MGKKKERIEVNPVQPSFHAAFANLEVSNLPAGPDAPVEEAKKPPTKLGRVVLRREKAHRGGKTVIVVHDFAPQISGTQIDELSKRLRTACGCGGAVREREIELQGDQPGKIRQLLEAEGFRVAGV